jgi:hypothetical protein
MKIKDKLKISQQGATGSYTRPMNVVHTAAPHFIRFNITQSSRGLLEKI